MESKYDSLKLEKQICFPPYACSREIIKQYKPFLDKIGPTYTQYITMMVLWERKSIHGKADRYPIIIIKGGRHGAYRRTGPEQKKCPDI